MAELSDDELKEIITARELSPPLREKLAASPELLAEAHRIADVVIGAWELGRPATPEEDARDRRIWDAISPDYQAMLDRHRAIPEPADVAGRIGFAAEPVRLAAQGAELRGDGHAKIRAAFVNVATGKSLVRTLWVHARKAERMKIRTAIEADPVMHGAVERAYQAALLAIRDIGRSGDDQAWQIDWGIEGVAAQFEGPSIGLAFALAVVAAVLGIHTDPYSGVVVTGAVDGDRVVAVSQIASKWRGLIDKSSSVDTFMLPAQSAGQLPAEARVVPRLSLLMPHTVTQAVVDLFGPDLGLAADRLAASAPVADATSSEAARSVNLKMWLTPPPIARSVGPAIRNDANAWCIGDQLTVRLLSGDRPCYFALLNATSGGTVQPIVPGVVSMNDYLPASQPVSLRMQLNGPPGTEILQAVALGNPLGPDALARLRRLPAAELPGALPGIVGPILGQDLLQFDVAARPPADRGAAAGTRSIGAAPAPGEQAAPVAGPDWGPIDLD